MRNLASRGGSGASDTEVTYKLRHSHPEIFSTALRFIATPLPHREILAFGNTLFVCECPSISPLHRTTHRKPATGTIAGERFYDSVCGIVLAGLGVYDPSIENISNLATLDDLVRKSKTLSGQTTWPSKHADVFPGEPWQVICMLWRIFNTFPKAEKPLYLFFVFWKLSYATVYRVVYRIEDGRWPEQLLGHANRVFDYKGRAKSKIHAYILPQLLMEVALSHTRYADLVNILIWIDHNLDVVRFASRLLLSDAFKDRADDQTTFLSRLGAMFWEIAYKVPLLDGETADFSEEERESLSPRINAPKFLGPQVTAKLQLYQGSINIATARERVRTILLDASQSEACAAPECFETTATKNHKFSMCGKCFLTPYCSKECQTAAWAHSMFPHKHVCRALKELNKKLQVDWKKIRTPTQLNALHNGLKSLSLQDCRDVEEMLHLMVGYKGHERAIKVLNSQGHAIVVSASPLTLWNVWIEIWNDFYHMHNPEPQ